MLKNCVSYRICLPTSVENANEVVENMARVELGPPQWGAIHLSRHSAQKQFHRLDTLFPLRDTLDSFCKRKIDMSMYEIPISQYSNLIRGSKPCEQRKSIFFNEGNVMSPLNPTQ